MKTKVYLKKTTHQTYTTDLAKRNSRHELHGGFD